MAVLQRPDAGQQGRHECGPGEDQPDPDGEVPQAAGRPENSGTPTHSRTPSSSSSEPLLAYFTIRVFVCMQLVWLVRELVKSGIMGADGVVMTLLKQVAGQCVHVCDCLSKSENSDSVCVLQGATSPPRTCGWLRVSWTSYWTRSTCEKDCGCVLVQSNQAVHLVDSVQHQVFLP